MSEHRYGVLGAGRQGTAAAYDLVVRGEATSVVLADVDPARAAVAAERVNRLAGSDMATGLALDATDAAALRAALESCDAVVSALPYGYNLAVAEAAVDTGTHHCDLGGNLPIVLSELELDERARARGVCVIPDCGEAPGLANNLVAYAMTLLDEPEDVLLLDGGLPLHPKPPWNYECTFFLDGLTNEYDGVTTYVIDGKPVDVDCLDPGEYEVFDFGPPFGTLEAFVGNTGSTTAWTLGKKLRTLKSKVVRYPGHAAQFRAFRDLGLFGREPVDVGGAPVVPRELLLALLEPRIGATPETRDVVVARVIAQGRTAGAPAEATVDLFVDYSEELGFTAMEQSTGWHAAIVCHQMASGVIAPGATPVEVAVDPVALVEECRRRGFRVTETVVA